AAVQNRAAGGSGSRRPAQDTTRHIVYRSGQAAEPEFILPVDKLGIPERHNVANALAATAVCIAAGARPSELGTPLASFKAVEHRLEFVCEKNGVKFYNDSKATNAQATISGIGSLDAPIVLIAGGLDRGSDYMELLPSFSSRLKALVTLGQ